MIRFELESTDSIARAGKIQLERGAIETPVFMPVGTQGSVKSMSPQELEEIGVRILLGNTYHLHLRPGEEIVRGQGGLHRFMNWPRHILTDSGGYQVFSLGANVRVSEQGAHFRNHIDGGAMLLTPESAVAIQEALGSDIMMCLDHLVAQPSGEAQVLEAAQRTSRWALRCKQARRETGDTPALFGIVQGGLSESLRQHSAGELLEIGFDGYAVGGLSVGEPNEAMFDVVRTTTALLPADRPRYLMGAGEPRDMLTAIGAGIDMFDCVLPTRNARNGTLYTRLGKLNIKQSRFRDDSAPLEPNCECITCRNYTRAYLSHLFRAGEILSMRLNTYHNIHFYIRMMAQARKAILVGRFDEFAKAFLHDFESAAIAETS